MVLKYSLPARFFHWATLLLIIAAWICVEFKGAIGPSLGMTLHKSFRVTLFCLVVIRLVYRLFDSPPPLNIDMPDWQKKGAQQIQTQGKQQHQHGVTQQLCGSRLFGGWHRVLLAWLESFGLIGRITSRSFDGGKSLA